MAQKMECTCAVDVNVAKLKILIELNIYTLTVLNKLQFEDKTENYSNGIGNRVRLRAI